MREQGNLVIMSEERQNNTLKKRIKYFYFLANIRNCCCFIITILAPIDFFYLLAKIHKETYSHNYSYFLTTSKLEETALNSPQIP